MFHKCFHPHCHAEIPTAMFGCKFHWFALPLLLRTAIQGAYWRFQRGEVGAIEHLREAQQAAIAYVNRNL